MPSDLLSCGPDVVHILHLALQGISDHDNNHGLLDKLITLAYENMPMSRGSCWRRLYTDASLLRSLAGVACAVLPCRKIALESIGILDRAIVIAGAPGEGRLDLILDCIENMQKSCFPETSFNAVILPNTPSSSPMRQLSSSSHDIPFIEPPSLALFQKSKSQLPFILRGYIRDWPAMKDHPWASIDYLRSIAGPGRIVPVEIGSDYRSDDWTQKLMDLEDFLQALDSKGQPHQKTSGVLYLAQHSLFKQFPALRTDIIVPDYIYASLPSPVDFPKYNPPQNDEQLVINAWLGPGGTVSPAHTVCLFINILNSEELISDSSEQDPYFNFYGMYYKTRCLRYLPAHDSAAQVVGHKTVWLAPPSMTSFMYPYPVSSIAGKSSNPAANTLNPSMSNTSQVDVFSSAGESGVGIHPLFWEKVVPNAISTTLQPGDLLFFPPGWWHAMRSEEKSFSVSMWF
jgi:lysine-specific demethylase 8